MSFDGLAQTSIFISSSSANPEPSNEGLFYIFGVKIYLSIIDSSVKMRPQLANIYIGIIEYMYCFKLFGKLITIQNFLSTVYRCVGNR